NNVEIKLVNRLEESICNPHDVFVDEEDGKQSRSGKNIAPPTFPRVFDYGEIEGLNLPRKGLIHGEQTDHYNRPLFMGEEVHCYTVVKDYYEKKGKNGLMYFLEVVRYGEDNIGYVMFTVRMIIIMSTTLRKTLNV